MGERPDRTLLLTTHYMHEADELCDRIAIIDRGRVLACDTPGNLKRRIQRYPIFEMALTNGANGWHHLGRLPGVHNWSHEEHDASVDVKVALEEEAAVGPVVQEIVNGGSQILSLKKVEPSLEDVFVELVGHGLVGRGVDA
jgi:ABC-2 type transport system ATP-binding protein